MIACSALLWAGCAAPVEPTGARPQPSSTPSPTAVETTEASAVEAVAPASGSVSGGTTLTITGTGLTDVTEVTVGGIPATDVTVLNDGTVTAVAPAAVNYQPAAAAIEVSSNGDAIGQGTALSYSYAVESGVDKQLQYALAYWKNYNEAQWGNLNPVGGDCANFVSQSLIQRGWTQDAAWYNKNAAADWSPAWGYVPAMDNWLAGDAAPEVSRLTLEQRDQVKVGDIAMFDWNLNKIPDHVMIVSKVIPDGDTTVIQMVGHNKDFDYRDLDETITVEHPGGNAWFWSIP